MCDYKIFVISGGTGRTGKQVVRAALTQFPEKNTEIVSFSDVRDEYRVEEIILDSKKYGAMIVHTIVDTKLREFIETKCKEMNIVAIDLLGNIIHNFSTLFSDEPLQSPGLFNKINHEYFQRIDAVQFTFKHDDGARVEDIDKADIILLGVSRTFKTPLSVYLSYKGYFVINIPIIDGIQPILSLSNIDPSKIFCLNTTAHKLSELRGSRSDRLGKYVTEYADVTNVKKELQFAMRYYNLHPEWKIINVTGKPIEEIASEILDNLTKKD